MVKLNWVNVTCLLGVVIMQGSGIYWLLVSVVHQMNIFLRKTCQISLSGQPHMLQILCSSVRLKCKINIFEKTAR